MGLLITPSGEGSTVDDDERLEDTELFLPWKFISPPEVDDDDGRPRLARLTWRTLPAPLEESVPLDNVGIELESGQRELVRDTQGRTIVARTRRGRGEVALSLARDTWRWQLAAQPQAFAGYWSFVLSEISKRQSSDSWQIANDPTAPLYVDEPVELRYSTAANTVDARRGHVAIRR